MKKFYLFCASLFLLLTSPTSSFAQAIEEVVVTGTRGDGYDQYELDTGINSPGYMLPYSMGAALNSNSGRAAYEREKSIELAKKACNQQADNAGTQCQQSYNQLETMCRGFNGILGGGASAAAKKFFEKIGSELSKDLYQVMITGSVAMGATIDNSIVPCGDLTAKAMAFCAAGVQKMKKSCEDIR